MDVCFKIQRDRRSSSVEDMDTVLPPVPGLQCHQSWRGHRCDARLWGFAAANGPVPAPRAQHRPELTHRKYTPKSLMPLTATVAPESSPQGKETSCHRLLKGSSEFPVDADTEQNSRRAQRAWLSNPRLRVKFTFNRCFDPEGKWLQKKPTFLFSVAPTEPLFAFTWKQVFQLYVGSIPHGVRTAHCAGPLPSPGGPHKPLRLPQGGTDPAE